MYIEVIPTHLYFYQHADQCCDVFGIGDFSSLSSNLIQLYANDGEYCWHIIKFTLASNENMRYTQTMYQKTNNSALYLRNKKIGKRDGKLFKGRSLRLWKSGKRVVKNFFKTLILPIRTCNNASMADILY